MDIKGPWHKFNQTLQAEKQTVSGMLANAKTVKNALMRMRTEEEFSSFIAEVNHNIEFHEVDPINSPRFRMPPKKCTGASPSYYTDSAEEHYRSEFFANVVAALQQ